LFHRVLPSFTINSSNTINSSKEQAACDCRATNCSKSLAPCLLLCVFDDSNYIDAKIFDIKRIPEKEANCKQKAAHSKPREKDRSGEKKKETKKLAFYVVRMVYLNQMSL